MTVKEELEKLEFKKLFTLEIMKLEIYARDDMRVIYNPKTDELKRKYVI